MNRAFTTREKVLILILVILLLVTGYYWIVATPVQNRIDTAKAAELSAQDEILVESVKAGQLKEMKAALEEAKNNNAKAVSSIPHYDNLNNVINQLDIILAPALKYDLTFNALESSDGLVKRPVSMNFTSSSYQSAKDIVESLSGCIYRCTLDGITVSAVTADREGAADLNQDGVAVTLVATFYEKE